MALLLVAALLVITSAPARGVSAALAGLTKFAPLALAPLFLRGVGRSWPRRRSLLAYVLAYGATIVVAMLPVILKHDLHAFWKDTIVYQADRVTPFSVWGLWGGLGFEQHLVEGAAVALAVAVAFVPRARGLVEVAALGGGRRDRARARAQLLAVLVHRVVLSARDRGRPRELSRPSRRVGYGAGSSTCSIASARSRADALITTRVEPRVLSRGLELDRHSRRHRLDRQLALDPDHAAARARSSRRR